MWLAEDAAGDYPARDFEMVSKARQGMRTTDERKVRLIAQAINFHGSR